jgi:hypothetical protein
MKVKDRELENVMAILRARKWDHVDLSEGNDSETDPIKHTVQVHVEYLKNTEHLQQTNVEECVESTTQEDDSIKLPGNNANDEKEQMFRKMRALKQFLCFKDRVIHEQKEVTKQIKEERIRAVEAAEQMKINKAAARSC